MFREILKKLLGVLAAALALNLGRIFLLYRWVACGGIAEVWVIFLGIGYLTIVLGLALSRKWAWKMFITIFSLAIIVEIILLVIGELKENFIEGVSHSIFWVSLVAIPVFGISALIRLILRKKNKNS